MKLTATLVCIGIAVLFCAGVVAVSALEARENKRERPRGWKAGGFSDDRISDADAQAVLTMVRAEIGARLTSEQGFSKMTDITVLSYQTQVVAGTIFKIKVSAEFELEEKSQFEVRVFRSLPKDGDVEYKVMSIDKL